MKRSVLIITLAVILLSTAGCAKIPGLLDKPTIIENNDPSPDDNPTNGEPVEKDVLDAETRALINANKVFAWDIFKQLNNEDSKENIFISSFSISSMLTMALNGAEGTTREAVENSLHYQDMSREVLNRSYQAYLKRISNLDRKVMLEIANSIWARDGFEIQKDFVDMNRKYLSAEAQTLDFDDPASVDVINGWISKKTNKLIPKMIDPPIERDTVMFLVNAIYFKGQWTKQFKPQNTQEKDFRALDGKKDKVMMMFRSGITDYYRNDELQAVRLPYGNEKTSMVVVLPNKNINEWIEGMDQEAWENILENLKPREIQLQIPKFKMEYGIKELNKALTELGMGEALSESANFSGIAEQVYISEVLHKAVVDVNEEGTEAAAATIGTITATSAVEPIQFIADHPFFFAIMDDESGNILFMGKKIDGNR